MRDLQRRLLSSRQRDHRHEARGLTTRHGRWEIICLFKKKKSHLKNIIYIVASSGSLMELARRKGTSHNCWELGRFSKYGVKTPQLFSPPAFHTAASVLLIVTYAVSSLPLAFIPALPPCLLLCLRDLVILPNFK